jgi:SRSO17 transposase
MIRQLQAVGFQFELVLADSLYGESKVDFVNVLDELELPYILAIRSNHALWLLQDQEVYQQPWQKFERTFSNGTTEVRYMAEVIYGKRHRKGYWLLTTDPDTLLDNSTSFVMVIAFLPIMPFLILFFSLYLFTQNYWLLFDSHISTCPSLLHPK